MLDIFSNITYGLTVTFDQFNASLENKNKYFYIIFLI